MQLANLLAPYLSTSPILSKMTQVDYLEKGPQNYMYLGLQENMLHEWGNGHGSLILPNGHVRENHGHFTPIEGNWRFCAIACSNANDLQQAVVAARFNFETWSVAQLRAFNQVHQECLVSVISFNIQGQNIAYQTALDHQTLPLARPIFPRALQAGEEPMTFRIRTPQQRFIEGSIVFYGIILLLITLIGKLFLTHN